VVESEARRFEVARQPLPAETRTALAEARAKAKTADYVLASQQVDPWFYAYMEGWAVPPYVDPVLATRAALGSDALTACIETMGRGVAGHGYELTPRIGQQAYELLDTDEKSEIEKEKLRIERWFSYCNPEIPFVEIYKRTVNMKETTAYAAWELLPDEAGNPSGIEPMPSYSVRLTPHPDDVLVPMAIQLEDGSWGVRRIWRRLRKVLQIINGRYRWFKLLGDPRFIDGRTGEVIGDPAMVQEVLGGATEADKTSARALLASGMGTEEDRADAQRRVSARSVTEGEVAAAQALAARMKEVRDSGNEAHEVLLFTHFGVSGGFSLYGVPRWYGATYAAIGRQKQQLVAMTYFSNNAIPRIAVLVAGATIGKEHVKQIEDYFKRIRGEENQHDVLVIQAAPYAEGDVGAAMGESRGQVKLSIERLNDALLKEATFLETAKTWLNDVRRAFGLPPILTGDSDDYARAVADTARLIAEEQVFQPERVLFDHAINHLLFPRLGFRHWLFKTGGAHISDETIVVQLLELMHKGAALSSEELRTIGAAKLGHPLRAIGKPEAQRPSLYNAALATGGPQRDPLDPWEETPDPEGEGDDAGQGQGSGAPGTAVPAEDPDRDPTEVGADDGSKAEVEAEETAAAVDGDGRAAPPRIWIARGVSQKDLETVEGLTRLRDAFLEALAKKKPA
jgi:PBSX family phage portal protein